MKKLNRIVWVLLILPFTAVSAVDSVLLVGSSKSNLKPDGWAVITAGSLVDESTDQSVTQSSRQVYKRARLTRELQSDCQIAETDPAVMIHADLGRAAKSFDLFKLEAGHANKIKALCTLFNKAKISAAAAQAEGSRYRVGLAYESAGTTKLTEQDERFIRNIFAVLAVY